MGNIHAVGPNEAVIVSGGCFGKRTKKIVVGGWVWAWWCVTNVKFLPLMLLTTQPRCEDVESVMGVPVNVKGVAQVKIDRRLLPIAAEQFAGRTLRYIREAATETMSGHLRAIIGSMTVEEVYRDREKLANLVEDMAKTDLAAMGMTLVSLVITDIDDKVGYLYALGRKQIADVKRTAQIAIAENKKIAGIREAECEREACEVEFQMQALIENNRRLMETKMAEFNTEVNAAKAQAELAYSLQQAVVNQRIKEAEVQIDVVETRKNIEVEELEIRRKELELISTVRLPAEGEAYRMEKIAEGEKFAEVENARAEASRIEKVGLAKADMIRVVGVAEGAGLKLKAKAFQQYNNAATASLVTKVLPEITAEVASILSKVEDIVIIGGNDSLTHDVTRLAGQLPPAVTAVAGNNNATEEIARAAGRSYPADLPGVNSLLRRLSPKQEKHTAI